MKLHTLLNKINLSHCSQVRMELKYNDHLSKTFSNFEKRIEQDLIVPYKNNFDKDKRLRHIEEKIKQIELQLKSK